MKFSNQIFIEVNKEIEKMIESAEEHLLSPEYLKFCDLGSVAAEAEIDVLQRYLGWYNEQLLADKVIDDLIDKGIEYDFRFMLIEVGFHHIDKLMHLSYCYNKLKFLETKELEYGYIYHGKYSEEMNEAVENLSTNIF